VTVGCFLPGRAKDLSAPLYKNTFENYSFSSLQKSPHFHNFHLNVYEPLSLAACVLKILSSIFTRNPKIFGEDYGRNSRI
jgi:hypothetical protein